MSADKISLVKFPCDLNVKWLTYCSDSVGLLDFEHKDFYRHNLRIRKGSHSSDVYLVGEGPSCYVFPSHEKALSFLRSSNRGSVLVKISCEDGKLFVSSPDPELFGATSEILRLISDKACRRIFGHFRKASVLPIALQEGDEIRLGRAKLTVRHMAFNSSLPMSYFHDLIADESESAVCTAAPGPEAEAPRPAAAPDDDDDIRSNATSIDLSGHVRHGVAPIEREVTGSTLLLKPGAEELGKDDDDLTVCDLSTSRTNLTAENTVSAADAQIQLSDQAENTCRICLCDDDASGPLITPCKCKGSLTFVHLSCIRSWIKGRLNCCPEGVPNKAYFWQKLTCELCGTVYPNKISIDNTEEDFVDIDQPAPPYMVLEPENVTEKGYFIVSLAGNDAVIGRGHDSDIRLTDISVSRTHSVLYFQNDRFIIQDRKSKFGTLINTTAPGGLRVQITPSTPILLKIGNGILCISMRQPWRPFSLCFGAMTPQATSFSV